MNALSIAWKLRIEMSAILTAVTPGRDAWGHVANCSDEANELQRGQNSEFVGLFSASELREGETSHDSRRAKRC